MIEGSLFSQLYFNTIKPYGMKHTKPFLIIAFLLWFGILSVKAQQGVVAAGGEATGHGGTMSFSTGQTDFMYFSSEAGSIQFGMQQVFFFDDPEDVPEYRYLTSNDILHDVDQCFDAKHTIVLAAGDDSFIVETGTGVDLIAGYSIHMLQGTMVEYGGYLNARITSSEGPFCDDAEKVMFAGPRVDKFPDEASEPLHYIIEKPAKRDQKQTFFRVYPNPTTGNLILEILNYDLIGQTVSINVVGMRGEVVKQMNQISFHQNHLSLQNLQPGLYVLRVQISEDFGIERVIKK